MNGIQDILKTVGGFKLAKLIEVMMREVCFPHGEG